MTELSPPDKSKGEFGPTMYCGTPQEIDRPALGATVEPVPTPDEIAERPPEHAAYLVGSSTPPVFKRIAAIVRAGWNEDLSQHRPVQSRPKVIKIPRRQVEFGPRRRTAPISKNFLPKALIMGTGLALAITLLIDNKSHDSDNCTSPTRARFSAEANTSWDAAASLLSDKRYVINPQALRRANLYSITHRPSGKASSDLAPGMYCLDLPAPVIDGEELADGQKNMLQVAMAHKLKVVVLLAQNNLLRLRPESVPPAGTIINVSSPRRLLNPDLVLQRNPYSSLSHYSGAKLQAIKRANAWAIEHGQAGKGKALFLPPPKTVDNLPFASILRVYGLIK